MTKDEELQQLRQEKTALLEALRRKDEELAQSQQANQTLREGLKQAIMAIDSQQELAEKKRQETRRRDATPWASSPAGGAT
jgi:hypothetical protein